MVSLLQLSCVNSFVNGICFAIVCFLSFLLLVLIFIYIFRGGRKLIHHPSLADFGAKRQIVVQKIPKAKVGKSLMIITLG